MSGVKAMSSLCGSADMGGMFGMRGPAKLVDAEKFAYDAKTARKLWDLSQMRTGEVFRFD